MRILLIEDEEDISYFIKKGLEAETFAVDVATDGEKGEFLAATNEYDVIILDVYLPKKNGVEICKSLRKRKLPVPVLMLTIESCLEHKVEALESGADDYLLKPFALEELLARVRALARRQYPEQSKLLAYEDLVLDTTKHLVTRNNKVISLRKKEYSLLDFFMRNPDKVLSRSKIIEHVWDINADPFTNTVDVHVRFLRKKINTGFTKELIQTIHGIGYKL